MSTALSPALSPAEALAVSRERLRQAWRQAAPGAAAAPDAWPDLNSPLNPLAALPPASLVAALLRRWWRRHPWRRAGVLAVQAADALARPVAQSHPVAWVAGAAAAGALLVWMRPWRLLRGAWVPVAARLVPQLLPDLLQNLLRPPSR